MARVTNDHGSFEAPDGWTLLDSVGATDGAPDPRPEARVFVRSLVLTGDGVPAGVTGEAYMEHQKALLGASLPRFTLIDAHVPTPVEYGPCVLRYQFLPPDADAWLVQFQSYWFLGGRASILTMTARADDLADAWGVFVGAAEGFTFPAAPDATAT